MSASLLGGCLDRPWLSPSHAHISATGNSKLANEEKDFLRLEFSYGHSENLPNGTRGQWWFMS